MSIEFRIGDLFDQEDLEAIGHGVNCKGKMGSGIAVDFKKRYPTMHEKYVQLCDRNLLKLGNVFPWRDSKDFIIFNMATQFNTGRNAEYQAVEETVKKVLKYCEDHDVKSVGFPRIGAGIGGLEWEKVKELMIGLCDSSPIKIVVVSLPNK